MTDDYADSARWESELGEDVPQGSMSVPPDGTKREPLTSDVSAVPLVPHLGEHASTERRSAVEIELFDVLTETEEVFNSYAWFPSEHHSVVFALFVAVTYAQFPTAPYLFLHSPEPESGKTTVLDLLGVLVRNPVQSGDMSAAAIYRAKAQGTPTWILDEIGKLLGGERDRANQVAAILNCGYKAGHGSNVLRVEREGDAQVVREFNTFGPKVLAAIESLDHRGDFLSRTIVLEMQRKPAGVPKRAFLSVYAWDHYAPLRERYSLLPPIPDGDELSLQLQYERYAERFGSGRLSETWTPLLEVARLAGGSWLDRALGVC